MGRGLSRSTARQHPDLTTRAPGGARVVILAVLAFDGVLSAVVGALLLPVYLGSIPFPVSALISGLVNAALVWAALLLLTIDGLRSRARTRRESANEAKAIQPPQSEVDHALIGRQPAP